MESDFFVTVYNVIGSRFSLGNSSFTTDGTQHSQKGAGRSIQYP